MSRRQTLQFAPKRQIEKEETALNILQGLVGDYGSDDDDDDNNNKNTILSSKETKQNNNIEKLENKNQEEKSTSHSNQLGEEDSGLQDFLAEINEIVSSSNQTNNNNNNKNDKNNNNNKHYQETKEQEEQEELKKINNDNDIWKVCLDCESGDLYYWNLETNEVTWEEPKGYNFDKKDVLVSKFQQQNEKLSLKRKNEENNNNNQSKKQKKENNNNLSEINAKFDSLKEKIDNLKKKIISSKNLSETTILGLELSGEFKAWNEYKNDSLNDEETEFFDFLVLLKNIDKMETLCNDLTEKIENEGKKKKVEPIKTQIVQKPPQSYVQPTEDILAYTNNYSTPTINSSSSTTTTTNLFPQYSQSSYTPSASQVLLPGWTAIIDPTSGQYYYHNYLSGVTQWDPPISTTSSTTLSPEASPSSPYSTLISQSIYTHPSSSSSQKKKSANTPPLPPSPPPPLPVEEDFNFGNPPPLPLESGDSKKKTLKINNEDENEECAMQCDDDQDISLINSKPKQTNLTSQSSNNNNSNHNSNSNGGMKQNISQNLDQKSNKEIEARQATKQAESMIGKTKKTKKTSTLFNKWVAVQAELHSDPNDDSQYNNDSDSEENNDFFTKIEPSSIDPNLLLGSLGNKNEGQNETKGKKLNWREKVAKNRVNE